MIGSKAETERLIAAPSGQLELAVYHPDGPVQAWGVVCHPHPLFGGTMMNKVVTVLIKVFAEMGWGTVRFNFRGVGKSTGAFDHGHGEVDDLLAVMNWLKQECRAQHLYLGGFSFGAYIAAEVAGRVLAATVSESAQLPLRYLVLVAPPVARFPMRTVLPITCPWMVVQGGQDEVVAADAVLTWAKNRNPSPTIVYLQEAGHFFHGQLTEMGARIKLTLSAAIS